ncbi:unnamed protein product [Chrysoparadoxa australica]
MTSLALDKRPQVRNCAMNTLFSTMVDNGTTVSDQQWEQFLQEMTLPLLARVQDMTAKASESANTAVVPELKKGVPMVMHHSRDTDRKQWNETLLLAMQGLSRFMRSYVSVLGEKEWFRPVWLQGLEVFVESVMMGSASQEVALGGVEGLMVMLQLVSSGGIAKLRARISTDMRVVDGMLQRMSPPRADKAANKVSLEFELARQAYWKDAWLAVQKAATFPVDEGGDVAAALVRGLVEVYKGGKEAEFAATAHAKELLAVMDSLILPRYGQVELSGAARRGMYRATVTTVQREILSFLKDTLEDNQTTMLHMLVKYSRGLQSSTGGLTPQCTKEAQQCLMELLEGDGKGAEPVRAALRGCLGDISSEIAAECLALLHIEDQGGDAAQVMEYWPAAPSHCSELALLTKLLQVGLERSSQDEGEPTKGELLPLHQVVVGARHFGAAWARGSLGFTPTLVGESGSSDAANSGDSDPQGEAFGTAFKEVVFLLLGALQGRVGDGSERRGCVADLADLLGDVLWAAVNGTVVARNMTFFTELLGMLVAMTHDKESTSLRRRAQWQLLRVCASTLQWFVKMEGLEEGSLAASAEPYCVLALKQLGSLLDEDMLLGDSLMELAVDSKLAADGAASIPAEEWEEDLTSSNLDLRGADDDGSNQGNGSGTSTVLQVQGKGSHLLAMCPTLFECLGTESRVVRVAASQLLQEARIPDTIAALRTRNCLLAAEVDRLKQV